MTKTAKETEASVERSSHPKVVGFDSSSSIIRQVCSQLQSRHCQQLAGTAFHRRFCPDAMDCSRRSLSFNSGSLCFDPLLSGHLPPGSHVRDRIRRVVLPLRIPKLPKLCSTTSTRRSHEDIFFRSQSTSPGIHLLWADPVVGVIGTSAAHAPSGTVLVSVCLSHQRHRSRINASLTCSLSSGQETEMFRSIASSLISSDSESIPAKWQ